LDLQLSSLMTRPSPPDARNTLRGLRESDRGEVSSYRSSSTVIAPWQEQCPVFFAFVCAENNWKTSGFRHTRRTNRSGQNDSSRAVSSSCEADIRRAENSTNNAWSACASCEDRTARKRLFPISGRVFSGLFQASGRLQQQTVNGQVLKRILRLRVCRLGVCV
jgi:hypothetical protein